MKQIAFTALGFVLAIGIGLGFSSGSLGAPKSPGKSKKAKCEAQAQVGAHKALQEEDKASGTNGAKAANFTALNNGGIYVFSGYIQKVFDWQIVVIVDRDCKVQSTYLSL